MSKKSIDKNPVLLEQKCSKDAECTIFFDQCLAPHAVLNSSMKEIEKFYSDSVELCIGIKPPKAKESYFVSCKNKICVLSEK